MNDVCESAKLLTDPIREDTTDWCSLPYKGRIRLVMDDPFNCFPHDVV